MRQGCKVIQLEDTTVIICGGESTDHKCNEDAICYDTISGERHIFETEKEASKWYDKNYKNVTGGSVACSICGRVASDNAMWL